MALALPVDNITIATLAALFLPLLSFIILVFLRKGFPQVIAWLAVAIMAVCFGIAIYLFLQIQQQGIYQANWVWFKLHNNITFGAGFFLDTRTVAMLVVVTFVALLVHIYSIPYKKGDRHYNRFFAYLGLFIFSMTGVVIADNLLLIFIFWELVGFSSYLLIGFWYDKESAVKASKKAFLVNRVADVAFLIGILVVWAYFGQLNLYILKYNFLGSFSSHTLAGIAGLFIFIGCMGKSAQFPFQLWLPDAMEGPTPVSALIHAATMVAAGVYLMVKCHFLINLNTGYVIASIGTITAFTGAFAALTQYDLKRVLAFSTISQLGFMMAAIGIGAIDAAFFHLVSHAFFKACLFLSAGSVIHAFHHVHQDLEKTEKRCYFDKQDMRIMGGVYKHLPITSIAFIVSGCALAGIPFTTGFASKETILVAFFNNSVASGDSFITALTVVLFITSAMTAFYIFRLIFTVFLGELKIEKLLQASALKLHESSKLMCIPLLLLAALSIVFIFNLTPLNGLTGIFELADVYHMNHYLVMGISVILVSVGLISAILLYHPAFLIKSVNIKQAMKSRFKPVYNLSFNAFYLDKAAQIFVIKPILAISSGFQTFDSKVIDYFVNLTGVFHVVLANILSWIDRTFVDGLIHLLVSLSNYIGSIGRKLQSGNIQSYFLVSLVSLLLLILFLFVYL